MPGFLWNYYNTADMNKAHEDDYNINIAPNVASLTSS